MALNVLTVHNSRARCCFCESITLRDLNAQTNLNLFVSVWRQWRPSRQRQPKTSAEKLRNFAKDDLIQKRCLIAAPRPRPLIFVRELKYNFCYSRTFRYFFLNTLSNPIQYKLKQKFHLIKYTLTNFSSRKWSILLINKKTWI